jgi:hypothetical protein
MEITKKARKIIDTAIVCPLCGVLRAKILRGVGCCVSCARKHTDEVIGKGR